MSSKPGTNNLGVCLMKGELVAKNLSTISAETSSTVAGSHWGFSLFLFSSLESTAVTPVSKSGLAPLWEHVI